MNTITLPVAEAVRAAAALVVHASKDDVTPVITGAAFQTQDVAADEKVNGSATVTYWAATDRYTVGRWQCSTQLEGESFIVPRGGLDWIKSIKETSVRVRGWWGQTVSDGGYGIRITEEEHDVLIELFAGEKVERSQRFDTIRGNFPPVSRLFPDFSQVDPEGTPARISLKQETLAKAIANLTTLADGRAKESVLTFHLQPSEAHKPAPVFYSIGRQFAALLQPNIILK